MKCTQREKTYNVYNYECESCGSIGELKVPNFEQRVNCPEGCGALYIQWLNPISSSPELKCVVCPMFADYEK